MWIVSIVYTPKSEITGTYAYETEPEARSKRATLLDLFKRFKDYRIDMHFK